MHVSDTHATCHAKFFRVGCIQTFVRRDLNNGNIALRLRTRNDTWCLRLLSIVRCVIYETYGNDNAMKVSKQLSVLSCKVLRMVLAVKLLLKLKSIIIVKVHYYYYFIYFLINKFEGKKQSMKMEKKTTFTPIFR